MDGFRIFKNKAGRQYAFIGPYKVVKESRIFTGIYKEGELITSRSSWRSATKTACLLYDAYQDGREAESDGNYYWT